MNFAGTATLTNQRKSLQYSGVCRTRAFRSSSTRTIRKNNANAVRQDGVAHERHELSGEEIRIWPDPLIARRKSSGMTTAGVLSLTWPEWGRLVFRLPAIRT
jgi:hypothetical protein